MEYKEFTGKSIDDAITEACTFFSVTSDRLDYEVLEKGASGFLGFGNKPAVIKACIKNDDAVNVSNVKETAVKEVNSDNGNINAASSNNDPKEFLDKVFKAMGMEVNINVETVENEMNIELSGSDMGVLIGKRGQTLDADFKINPADYEGACGGIIIPNPNAPTGVEESVEFFEKIVKAHPECVVMVDEAYVDFGAKSCLDLIDKYENLLVIRTFSKSRSMAGNRIGYAIGSEKLMK